MDRAKQLLEDFVAGHIDAAAFQERYLSIWREMRDKGELWAGPSGQILGSMFDPVECFDSGLTAGEPTGPFVLNEAQFRSEILALHGKLHTQHQAA